MPLAGLIDTVCFDKTGTLTEAGLGLQGVVPAVDGGFGRFVADPYDAPLAIQVRMQTLACMPRTRDCILSACSNRWRTC